MSDALSDRLPPHNQEAERGVLGGILRDPDELSSVQQIIRAYEHSEAEETKRSTPPSTDRPD